LSPSPPYSFPSTPLFSVAPPPQAVSALPSNYPYTLTRPPSPFILSFPFPAFIYPIQYDTSISCQTHAASIAPSRAQINTNYSLASLPIDSSPLENLGHSLSPARAMTTFSCSSLARYHSLPPLIFILIIISSSLLVYQHDQNL